MEQIKRNQFFRKKSYLCLKRNEKLIIAQFETIVQQPNYFTNSCIIDWSSWIYFDSRYSILWSFPRGSWWGWRSLGGSATSHSKNLSTTNQRHPTSYLYSYFTNALSETKLAKYFDWKSYRCCGNTSHHT